MASSSAGEDVNMSKALSVWNTIRNEKADFDDSSSTSNSRSSSKYENEMETSGFVDNRLGEHDDNVRNNLHERIMMVELLSAWNRLAVGKAVFDEDSDETSGFIKNRQGHHDAAKNSNNNDSSVSLGLPRADTLAVPTITNDIDRLAEVASLVKNLQKAYRSMKYNMNIILEESYLIAEILHMIEEEFSHDAYDGDSSISSYHNALIHAPEYKKDDDHPDPRQIGDPPGAELFYPFIHDEYEEERACNSARMEAEPVVQEEGATAHKPAGEGASEGASGRAGCTRRYDSGGAGQATGEDASRGCKRASPSNEDENENESHRIRDDEDGYETDNELEEADIREYKPYRPQKKPKISGRTWR